MINFIDKKVKIKTVDNKISEGEVIITTDDHLCLDMGELYSFIYLDKIIWITLSKEELFKDIPLEDDSNESYEISNNTEPTQDNTDSEIYASISEEDMTSEEDVPSAMYIPSSLLVEEEKGEKVDNTFSISFSGTAEGPWPQERK